jgi:hypothetical protein
MATLERDVVRVAGVRFFQHGDVVMFEHTVDALNVIGPRPVKEADKAQFAGEWARFVDDQPLSQLDHDRDGLPGGSLRLQQFEIAARQAELTAEAVVNESLVPKPKRRGRPRGSSKVLGSRRA